MTTIERVKEFHDAMGVTTPSIPTIPSDKVITLRFDLIMEELNELSVALLDRDKVEVLDALTDLQYVLDGAYLAFGMAHLKEKAFQEVHRSNMSKLGADGKPILSESGKILKPDTYSPPNLKQFIDND